MPCKPAVHAKGRDFKAKLDYYRVLKGCDEVEIIQGKDRESRLVAQRTVCLCFYNYEEKTKTADLFTLAENTGAELINLY